MTVSENPDVFEVLGGRPSIITGTRSTSNSPKSSASSQPSSYHVRSDGSPSVSDQDMMDFYDDLALG
ncbi:hypothetical protein V5O48_019722, partial [Marasmius crinis-equi]